MDYKLISYAAISMITLAIHARLHYLINWRDDRQCDRCNFTFWPKSLTRCFFCTSHDLYCSCKDVNCLAFRIVYRNKINKL